MTIDDSPIPFNEMKKPDVKPEMHKQQLKLMLFNAKKSAALGVWLIAVPCFFFFSVVMKHLFHVDLHVFTIMEEFIASVDRTSGIPFLSPVLVVGLPLLTIAVNALAIIHVDLDRERSELVATLKLQWLNIVLIVLSLSLVGIFLLYAITENIHHHIIQSIT